MEIFRLCCHDVFWASHRDKKMPKLLYLNQFIKPILICQYCLRWLGCAHRLNDSRIRKEIMYGKLDMGRLPESRLTLRFKAVCNTDLEVSQVAGNSQQAIVAAGTILVKEESCETNIWKLENDVLQQARRFFVSHSFACLCRNLLTNQL